MLHVNIWRGLRSFVVCVHCSVNVFKRLSFLQQQVRKFYSHFLFVHLCHQLFAVVINSNENFLLQTTVVPNSFLLPMLPPSRCATGYHGNPQMLGSRCEECKCSLWGALPGPCDPVTGQCRCRVGASGKSCDQCMERHVCGPAGIICKTNEQLFLFSLLLVLLFPSSFVVFSFSFFLSSFLFLLYSGYLQVEIFHIECILQL